MKKFKLKNYLFNLIVLFVAAILLGATPAVAATIAVPTAVVTGTLLSIIPVPKAAYMALQKEIWGDHLIGNYWKDNAFAKSAVQCAKSTIYNGKVVHIPKVNGKPEVVRNLSVFPATPTIREDIDILYLIDQFFVKPWRITKADEYELSYAKKQNMVGEQSAAANEMAADWLLRHWFTYTQTNNDGTTLTETAKILRTSGAAAGATIGTGNRKLLTVADFKKAKVQMNKANVPKTERYAIVDSEMLDQLTQDEDYKRAERIYEKELVEGTVAKVQGFNIYERSQVLEFDAAGTNLLAYGAVASSTENAGALLWQKQGVETAMGGIDWFDDFGNPLYYGDIFSCLLRASGRIRRSDSVVAMVQATAV